MKHDLTKMYDVAYEEVDKIAGKGLNQNNIEHAYKLLDMLKDIKTIEAMEDTGHSEAMMYDDYAMTYGDTSNARRRRDSMGRYSRGNSMTDDGSYNSRGYAEARYSQAKRDYRNSRAGKEDVMDSLNDKMRELKKELEDMSKDSDFPEERQTINKYVDMLNKLI